MKIPCKECLVYIQCKNRVGNKGVFYLTKLERCKLLAEFMYDDHMDVFTHNVNEVRKLFGLIPVGIAANHQDLKKLIDNIDDQNLGDDCV